MTFLDYLVLIVYFLAMIVIGAVCARWIKKQEDYFMGGRGFGKLLQTFAAFGAGTGSNDPIQVGRTTWTSGLSGIWSVLLWLFATPFYWICAVWYRRMRLLTLGDWFVERYESKSLGAAYTVFGISFYVFYLSAMFSAISKVLAPMLQVEAGVPVPWSAAPIELKWLLVPTIAIIVITYSVLGGLRAAYWTDLIQGLCIIFLSIILIPVGLNALAQDSVEAGNREAATVSVYDGFEVLHERLTPEYFQIVGGPAAGEFPLHFVLSLIVLVIVGIVVQPHFIATGGGSAKTENSARIGLVVGNFLKRFCTIGWALTGLIALAYFAGNPRIESDPDYVWGVASRELLGPLGFGLVGLMVACLLAALMSSTSAYMLVSSALVTRNIYAAYINPEASEARYVLVGRLTGLIIIVGAALVSLSLYDVFAQFLLAVELPIIFAAPFWVGMYWRWATKWAAWLTVLLATFVFFVVPPLVPQVFPEMLKNSKWTETNIRTTTLLNRPATQADVQRRQAQRELWEEKRQEAEALSDPSKRREAIEALASQPEPLTVGEMIEDRFVSGGKPVFWTGPATPIGEAMFIETSRTEHEGSITIVEKRSGEVTVSGLFRVDFLIYRALGFDLTQMSDAMLTTLRLPARIIIPFIVMIALSLITPRNSTGALDRYYARMKTPVNPDPEEDRRQLDAVYADPHCHDDRRLIPALGLEIQRPRVSDVVGVLVCLVVSFAFIGLAVWLAGIGG